MATTQSKQAPLPTIVYLLAVELIRGVRFRNLSARYWTSIHAGGNLPNFLRDDRAPLRPRHPDLSAADSFTTRPVLWGWRIRGPQPLQARRPFQRNYGLDHHPRALTGLDGGGRQTRNPPTAVTDYFCYNAWKDPSRPDSTPLSSLARINHERLTFNFKSRTKLTVSSCQKVVPSLMVVNRLFSPSFLSIVSKVAVARRSPVSVCTHQTVRPAFARSSARLSHPTSAFRLLTPPDG